MELDLKKISKAWFDSFFGSPQQKELALKRIDICESCPSRKIITNLTELGTICGECGCPIKKKVFSIEFNDCPSKKWEDIDSQYPNIFKRNLL